MNINNKLDVFLQIFNDQSERFRHSETEGILRIDELRASFVKKDQAVAEYSYGCQNKRPLFRQTIECQICYGRSKAF